MVLYLSIMIADGVSPGMDNGSCLLVWLHRRPIPQECLYVTSMTPGGTSGRRAFGSPPREGSRVRSYGQGGEAALGSCNSKVMGEVRVMWIDSGRLMCFVMHCAKVFLGVICAKGDFQVGRSANTHVF